ncbi:MAG: hypothetical protein LZ159_00580 [Thaumarchaeota archaeon]|nr:hypothetical protein [Candidatus Terraquivivens yellowstonensis]
MKVSGHLVGPQPRSEELMKVYREYAKGKLAKQALDEVIRKETEENVKIQMENDFTVIIDGMLNWHDLLRPFAERLSGVEVGGLARWFDNNVFYKQPVIVGKVERTRPLLENMIFYDLVPPRKLKVIVPDPYTFSKLSVNKSYRRFEDLVYDVAEAMAEEIRVLPAVHVQLTAPSLVYEKLPKDEIELAMNAVEIVRRKYVGTLSIHTCFGSVVNAMPELLDFPVDIIGVDMTVTSFKDLKDYDFTKILGIGCVDARNTVIETPDEIVSTVMRVFSETSVKQVYVSPSAGLEFLPNNVANIKIRNIGFALKLLREV